MKSAPPAAGLGRERQTCLAPLELMGAFIHYIMGKKNVITFVKEFTLVKYKGSKWEKVKQRQFCDRFTVSK